MSKQKIAKETNNCIDVVIAWVDGGDVKWQEKRKQSIADNRKLSEAMQAEAAEHQNMPTEQYRDWGTLPYALKSIAIYAPWVRRIFLVTDSQIPACLDAMPDEVLAKLSVVDHKDFIPSEYLPTFNANPIELNFHRIEGLSEQFIYFNDDFILTNPVEPTDFFVEGKPVDEACLNGINGKDNVFAGIQFHNMALMNAHYDIKAVRKNLSKWLHISYGKENIRTLLLLPFKRLQGIRNPHGPMPLLKSTYENVWERDYDILHKTCLCKTRDESNVSVYAMRYEQLLSANFVPKKNGNCYLEVTDAPRKIAKALANATSVCINDVSMSEKDFAIYKKRIIKLLDEKFSK